MAYKPLPLFPPHISLDVSSAHECLSLSLCTKCIQMKCINIFHYAMWLLMATELTEHNTPLCKWNRKELYIMKWHCRCCHRRRCRCCCSSYCVFDSKINDAARSALGIHEIHRPLRHSFYLSSSALSWRSSKPFFLISYCLQTVRQCQPKSQNTRKTGDG